MQFVSTLKQQFDEIYRLVQGQYGAGVGATVEIVEDSDKWTDGSLFQSHGIVRVHLNVSVDANQLRHDMLHESVHVLNPPEQGDYRSRLEEAAAVAISYDASLYRDPGWANWSKSLLANDQRWDWQRYYQAFDELKRLTDIQPNLIRCLRSSIRASLTRDIRPEDILRLVPSAGDAAERLCRAFPTSEAEHRELQREAGRKSS